MKFKIVPIAGDASFRKFYRLVSEKKNKIIISAQQNKYQNLTAYVAINNFLRKNKILAPKLIDYNYAKGLISIEDFGDNTFYQILLKKKNKLNIYKKIVNLLLKIQKIKPKRKIRNINNSFYIIEKYSKKYLLKESNLFFDWYLPLFLNKKKALNIKKKSNKILQKLYKKIDSSKSCFVHRDYHVKNLMSVGKKIAVIDTQDALIGHPAYDLVSLIDDVRIRTSTKLKNQIYEYYVKKNSKVYKKNSYIFLKDFEILSVQRNLKIIGIFSRLFVRDEKKKYLKLIPYTWQLLEMRMNSKIFDELKNVFNHNIPKNIRKKVLFK